MRGDSVAAVVLNEDTQRILLTNQIKYPTFEKGPGWISEIVAGVVERDELPEQAIRREILEELGYRARDLTYVSTFYVSPGGTSERIILYSTRVRNADKVQAGGGLDSEDEDIKLVEIPLNDLNNVLQREEIQDAKTLVGLMWLMNESKDR
jgi:ADP-ribose pyrophosphatase